MKIVMVGAGNLATNLGKALLKAGNDILQVYSRTHASASALADVLGGAAVTDLDKITADADIYIVAVSDSAIAEFAPRLCKGREKKVFLHTAGSIEADVFKGIAMHYGVLYPMQTFSKAREVDFSEIPCFVEGNDDTAFVAVNDLANGISNRVYLVGSDARRQLHLAAVFACNFVNHCYEISAELLSRSHIPFDVMLPLIDETARKVHTMQPVDAQTGPAVRDDRNVIRAQSELLKDNPMFKQIYESMSFSIRHTAQTKAEKHD